MQISMRGKLIHVGRDVQNMYKEMVKEMKVLHCRRSHPNNNMHQSYIIIDLLFNVH